MARSGDNISERRGKGGWNSIGKEEKQLNPRGSEKGRGVNRNGFTGDIQIQGTHGEGKDAR